MINIFIADDHPLVREGYKKIIQEELDMHVIGEIDNGNDLIGKLGGINVDILLLDLRMPGKSGMALLKEIQMLYPELLILVVTMLPEEHYAIRTLKAGANGFVNKSSAIDKLINAIRSIINRGKYISPEIAELLFEQVDEKNSELPHKNLSDREFQIMCMIADSKKVSEIADSLMLSKSTINTYRYRIMRKMNLKSNVEITHYVLENGLLS